MDNSQVWELEKFPPDNVENIAILKKVAIARSALAELKGVAKTIPNEAILIDTLVLQEAKDSSEIENIITTHDELYRAQLENNLLYSLATKEVANYKAALMQGFNLVKTLEMLTSNHIISIQETLENNNAGFRSQMGTTLKKEQTGEVVYTPPQTKQAIEKLMTTLEKFINDDLACDLDPLVKMALIHHQFESIHPFYDGNGRAGRIINILYLVQQGLLDLPILYLSRYINQNKTNYYHYLQDVRENGNWQAWIMYILDAIEKTSVYTIHLIKQIANLMQHFKQEIRNKAPKLYSQDLLNNLFKHPYTKIEFIEHSLYVSRPTATNYLNTLVEMQLLVKVKKGKSNYYVNEQLINILAIEHKL